MGCSLIYPKKKNENPLTALSHFGFCSRRAHEASDITMELLIEIFCKCGEPLKIIQIEEKKAFVENCGNCKADSYQEGYNDGYENCSSERDDRGYP